jgi:hypothetical protein
MSTMQVTDASSYIQGLLYLHRVLDNRSVYLLAHSLIPLLAGPRMTLECGAVAPKIKKNIVSRAVACAWVVWVEDKVASTLK